MYENFNLIHYECEHPLTQESPVFTVSDKLSVHRENSSDFVYGASPEGPGAPAICNSSYCLTGSFDFLLPLIRQKQLPDEYEQWLYLQSFCLMDNDARYFTKRAQYDSILISYTYSGEGILTYNHENHPLRAGTGFVINCQQPHAYRCLSDHWKHLDIHFWGSQAPLLLHTFQQIHTVTFDFPASNFTLLTENLLDAYTNQFELRDLYVGNALSNLLCSILKRVESSSSSNIPPVYKRIVRYLEAHYTQPVSLDTLSEIFHISKYHMSREFQRYTGHSPGEYLIMLRIQHACILLTQSDLSIESISAQSGFSNMSNFIGQFKKRKGMTPSAYRKTCVQMAGFAALL